MEDGQLAVTTLLIKVVNSDLHQLKVIIDYECTDWTSWKISGALISHLLPPV